MALTLVFVHGWSVTNLDTYGELPLRLKAEAAAAGIDLDIQEIYLGSYISFHDEVRVSDISRAFNNAVKTELASLLKNGSRFICITHSTGGPVVRDWWNKYYKFDDVVCPMSHLIMLAPANYGSALAQLGKGRISRLKSWWSNVEPGIGVLNWLSLGSHEAWDLNAAWIAEGKDHVNEKGIFPFVLTGQSIDRKFYDHLNPYTGELGSDGVVRSAAANLHGRLIKLEQPAPFVDANGNLTTNDFEVAEKTEAVASPFRILRKTSHSGDLIGIMKNVKRTAGQDGSSEKVKSILDCIRVKTLQDYSALEQQFAKETVTVQKEEQVETAEGGMFSHDRYFIHDRFAMVIFRIHDHEGFPLMDFDLILTAGKDDDPDHLPEGFCADRQKNSLSYDMVTYFFNYDIMKGCPPVLNADGEVIREAIKGTDMLGLEIRPRPVNGFVRYIPCRIKATEQMLEMALVPNSTTLIDICMQRVVDKQVFRSEKLGNDMPSSDDGDFSGLEPGKDFVS